MLSDKLNYWRMQLIEFRLSVLFVQIGRAMGCPLQPLSLSR